ncbi:probable protein dpy-30 homolog at C-terminar half [Coccomyxa sp. Obi]|nr:probable protein dpy-30 homolog at C-terminar half [Coccomyxa sp. Obi]
MADSDKIGVKEDVVDDESATGVEVDGALDRSIGANEQEHTEDTGREAVDDRTLGLVSKTEETVETVETPEGTVTSEEPLIPQKLSNVVVVTPTALAEDGELVRHGAPDTTDAERTSAEDGPMGITIKDGPEDLPVKEYLDATVVPVLRDGLRIVAKERPEDPYTFLGDYIKAHREAP